MPQMNTEGVKMRRSAVGTNGSAKAPVTPVTSTTEDEHPLGAPKHGNSMQLLRVVLFAVYLFTSFLFIHFAQLLGAPLYLISRDWFDAYMAMTKQYFGLLVTTMTQWWSPTTVRISGDKSMKDLLKQSTNGMLEVELGERVVLMANHQIYTDWLYLWWVGYANSPAMHGHIYIILKESLKYVPVIGPAMMFYGFIYMARKWVTDQKRMRHRLQKLNTRHSGQLDPMWLMIFPEGTNLSANTRAQSASYSKKSGIPDMKHLLLPRSTGLQFCLQELRETVDYVYDCTIAYEGIPPGEFGQDIFTLRSVYFQGRPPKSVNMHWRRFAIADMPLDSADEMYKWTVQRWREKDELIDAFLKSGKFPADAEAVHIEGGPQDSFKTAYISTEVMPRSNFEFLSMFAPVTAAALLGRIGVQILDRFLGKGSWF